MSRTYLAVLAAIAVLILAVGVVARRALTRDDAPASIAPPSEAAALQQLSHEGQLQRIAEFLDERVAAVAPFVEYLAEAHAAGVRWRADTVLSSTPDRPLVALRRAGADSL